MGKHWKRKKNSPQRPIGEPVAPPSGGLGLTYYQAPSPFEGLTQPAIIELIGKVGEDNDLMFQQMFAQLQEIVKQGDPLLLLSSLAAYGLSHKAGADPEMTQDNPILQAHVELIHALVLRHGLPEFQHDNFLTPERFDSVLSLAVGVQRSFSLRRLATKKSLNSRTDHLTFQALEAVRVNTQVIRNWAYVDQMVRVVRELFEPIEHHVQRLHGITVRGLMGFFDALLDAIAERFHRHFSLQRPVYRAKSIEQAIALYLGAFPVSEADKNLILSISRAQHATRSAVKSLLLGHSNLFLPDVYRFRLEELHGLYPEPVKREDLEEVLRRLSLRFGELATTNPEHLFLGNPIWRRPLIQIDDSTFFVPIPGLLRSNCLEVAEYLLEGDSNAEAKYEKRRGDYLEEATEKLLRQAFPQAQVFRGSQWTDPATGKGMENDLLVVLDKFAIVVEAKAGKMTEPARRGALGRLTRTIQDLMISPSIQAERFGEYLRANPGEHEFETRRGEKNRVNTSAVDEVIRISVTLDFLGAIASKWPDLQEAGMVPKGLTLAPTIALTDLEIVFDLLEGPSQKLHYLLRRSQFELFADYLGDEMDLLALYLDTGLNIGDMEFSREPLMIHGMSKHLDPFYLDESHQVPKPRLRLTKFWRDILSTVEQRQTPAWTQICCILLNVAYKDQAFFEKAVRRICNRTRRDWGKPINDNVAVLVNGPSQRRDIVMALAYRGLSRQERHQLIVHNAGTTASEHGSDTAVVIGYDVDAPIQPYNIIALVKPRKSLDIFGNFDAGSGPGAPPSIDTNCQGPA